MIPPLLSFFDFGSKLIIFFCTFLLYKLDFIIEKPFASIIYRKFFISPRQHLLHPRYLPQHPRHPVADYKHNRTEKQGSQHLIHLPVMAEYSPQAGKIFFYYHMQQIYNKCGVERLGAVLIAYSGNPVHVPGHVTGQTDSCCARLAMMVSRASPLESWWQKSHQKTKPFISIYT